MSIRFAAVNLPIEDFPIDDPRMSSVIEALGTDTSPISVGREDLMPEATCYQNCMQLVSANGGSICLGRMVTWVKEFYITMMHHAVWKKPDGTLVDKTTAQGFRTEDGANTTFVPDESIKIDFSLLLPIPNRHVVLKPDRHVRGVIQAYHKANALRREMLIAASKDPRFTATAQGPSGPPFELAFPDLYKKSQSAEAEWNYHEKAIRDLIRRAKPK